MVRSYPGSYDLWLQKKTYSLRYAYVMVMVMKVLMIKVVLLMMMLLLTLILGVIWWGDTCRTTDLPRMA